MEYQRNIKTLEAVLSLARRPVGVYFVKTKKEYMELEALEPARPLHYCQMVMSASAGHMLKARDETFRCRSGARAFGINRTDELNAKGENWYRLGLYKTEEQSACIRREAACIEEKNYGILIGEAGWMIVEPDVVLLIAEPFQCMRILQGYAYQYGMPKHIRMIGNQALCVECTAQPYISGDLNVSLLCTGTRHRTGWKDNEMAVGIPKGRLRSVADGILHTVNIMESDENKRKIAGRLRERGIEYTIKYQDNYYMHCGGRK